MNTESPFSQCKVHIYECVLYLLCILLFHGSMRLFARIISEIVSLRRSCSKQNLLSGARDKQLKIGKIEFLVEHSFFNFDFSGSGRCVPFGYYW